MTADMSRPSNFTEFLIQRFNDFPPDKVAVIEYPSGRSLTYSRLKSQVISVASALRKLGFNRGQFLTHFGANCLENIPLVFGAMGTGGSLNFVKPNASKDELALNLKQVRPRIVITTPEYLATLQAAIELSGFEVDEVFIVGEATPKCRSVQELLDDPGDASPIGKLETDEEEDIAMMLQTGGTTRMSKSVMVTHKGLYVTSQVHLYFFKNDDVVLSFPPISYNSAVIGSYVLCLSRGVTVVSMPKFDPEAICIAIEKYKVTGILEAPATVLEMIRSPEFPKRDLTSLRWIIWAGSPISKELEEFVKSEYREKAPSLIFAQVYGMTEALGIATWVIPEQATKPDKAGSVGVPLPYVEAKVVNPLNEDEIYKPNQPGHVFLKSSAIMKGYFKNEEMTAKAFRDGWYRTEDYGWIDGDGYLFIMDRIDELIIKQSGVIIPSTLEAIIQTHPNVKECVVLAKNVEGDKWPIAFVVSDGAVTEEEIKRFVAEKVEPYSQLKGGVRFVDKIPKSYAGKLLRKCFNSYLE